MCFFLLKHVSYVAFVSLLSCGKMQYVSLALLFVKSDLFQELLGKFYSGQSVCVWGGGGGGGEGGGDTSKRFVIQGYIYVGLEDLNQSF